jgi:hypothetical protein
MIISNSADLNNLKVGSLFRLETALKFSHFYIYGINKSTRNDGTISEITHINSKSIFSSVYVSEDYVLMSNLDPSILLNITFLINK